MYGLTSSKNAQTFLLGSNNTVKKQNKKKQTDSSISPAFKILPK